MPGTYQRLEFGEDPKAICVNANTSVKDCDDGFANTAPVGSFPANAFGLHDTIGNVWEFTEDCPTPNYEGAPTDGSVWNVGDYSKRVIRGAGWINFLTDHLRVSNRGWLAPKMSDVMTGLRVARTMTEAALVLGIAFKELATNAVKYGAFSKAVGSILIEWTLEPSPDGDRIILRWQEKDGPKVSPPTRKGFGTRMIERGLALELEGTAHLDYAPAGLICTINFPAPKVTHNR